MMDLFNFFLFALFSGLFSAFVGLAVGLLWYLTLQFVEYLWEKFKW